MKDTPFHEINHRICTVLRIIGVELIFCLAMTSFVQAQNTFFLKCIDADDARLIKTFNVFSENDRIRIINLSNGLFRLDNFKRGKKIEISADDYVSNSFQRMDKLTEIAAKHSGEPLLLSGDTIIVQLLPQELVLQKRWQREDSLAQLRDANINGLELLNDSYIVDSLLRDDADKIMGKSVHFPDHIKNQNIQGNVVISGIILPDGSLRNLRIEKHVERHLDRIALRACRNLQELHFTPIIQDGKAMACKIILKVSFDLR